MHMSDLTGIEHVGCYFVPFGSQALRFLEGTTTDLSDNPLTREEPIRKCGSAAQRWQYEVFAVSVGYCISGSNDLGDYQFITTQLCQGGTGRQVEFDL